MLTVEESKFGMGGRLECRMCIAVPLLCSPYFYSAVWAREAGVSSARKVPESFLTPRPIAPGGCGSVLALCLPAVTGLVC